MLRPKRRLGANPEVIEANNNMTHKFNTEESMLHKGLGIYRQRVASRNNPLIAAGSPKKVGGARRAAGGGFWMISTNEAFEVINCELLDRSYVGPRG